MLRPYFAAVRNDERPGAIPGAVVIHATAILRHWVAWTAKRYATGVAGPAPGIAFLVGQHTKRSDREVRQSILGQCSEPGEPAEALVVHPAMPFLVQR